MAPRPRENSQQKRETQCTELYAAPRLGITNYVVTFFRRNFRNYDVIRFFRKAKKCGRTITAAPGLHGQQSQELSTVPNELIPKMLHLRLHLAYLYSSSNLIMQSAENYTSLVDRRLSAPDYLTDCSAQSSDHVVSLVNYSLPQQGRRSTRGLASSTWCRWWRRAPRSGLGSRDSEADRRRE